LSACCLFYLISISINIHPKKRTSWKLNICAEHCAPHFKHSRNKQKTDQRVLVHTYTQIFSPKKLHCKKYFPNFFWLYYLYSMQLFCSDPTIFSKKFCINFFPVENLKNSSQKLLLCTQLDNCEFYSSKQ
jgi:hypothetical protein